MSKIKIIPFSESKFNEDSPNIIRELLKLKYPQIAKFFYVNNKKKVSVYTTDAWGNLRVWNKGTFQFELCENMNDKSAALVCENVTGLKRLADGAYQLFDEFADDTDDPGAILYGRVDGDRYRAEIEGFTDGGADFTFIPPRGYAEKFHTKLATERDLELLAGALSVAHRAGVNMEQLRNISKEVQE